MNASDTALAIAHTSSGAEGLAKKTKRARAVSAFGTSRAKSCSMSSRQNVAATEPALGCGNNDDAKNVVAEPIRDVGFNPSTQGHYESRGT
jgi:predicted dinucleotide-binding enzyme